MGTKIILTAYDNLLSECFPCIDDLTPYWFLAICTETYMATYHLFVIRR